MVHDCFKDHFQSMFCSLSESHRNETADQNVSGIICSDLKCCNSSVTTHSDSLLNPEIMVWPFNTIYTPKSQLWALKCQLWTSKGQLQNRYFSHVFFPLPSNQSSSLFLKGSPDFITFCSSPLPFLLSLRLDLSPRNSFFCCATSLFSLICRCLLP